MKTLLNKVSRFNDQRGWKKYHDPRSLALAICSEAGELAHLFRGCRRETKSRRVRDRASDELADILIFSLSLCDQLKLDPQRIVLDNLQQNASRFPRARQ